MTGYMITDRRNIKAVPELDVSDKGLATQLSEMPMSEVDSTVDRYEPDPVVKDEVYDIKALKLIHGEFLRHHSLAADSKGWMDQFKHLLPDVVADASLLVLNDVPVSTFRRDGQLVMSRLEKEQPHIVAEFTEMKTVPVFNKEKFKQKMPHMYHVYRSRSYRLKKAGAGAGLVLPA